jgi:hypothetical protein
MQAFQIAVAALAFGACMPAYAGTRITVERGSYTGPLEVRVGVPQEEGEPKWVAAKRLAAESVADLGSLPAGTYVVLLSGEAPLERFAAKLGVRGEGDDVLRLAVPDPRRVRGTIRLGTASAGDAVLSFRHQQFGWSTSFSAKEDGTFETPLWQGGEFVLIARGGALPSAVRRPVRIDGETLTVDLSPLRIVGVVSDDEGRPIPEASVALRNEFGRDRSTIRLLTDEHGMFDFVDVKPGPHTITVAADGYLISHDNEVYVTGETPSERVGITMAAGVPHRLRIVDPLDRPVPNAAVNVVGDARLLSTTITDVEGRATSRFPRRAPRPRGSFRAEARSPSCGSTPASAGRTCGRSSCPTDRRR